MIANDIITQLNNLPIEQIFAHYGHTVGREGTFSCPFHGDKTASMQISDNTFYCHGCFAGSSSHDTIKTPTPVSAVMAFERLSFPEAASVLGKRFGIVVDVVENRTPPDSYTLGLPDAIMRFHKALLNHEVALSYLHERGITMKDITFWKLGLGTDEKGLFSYLHQRLTFPLQDAYGEPVSITGRLILNPEEMRQLKETCLSENRKVPPKYLDRKPMNGKMFVKNNYLYGLYQATPSIRNTKVAYVTEGWTDVISAQRSGLHHIVSSMGLGLSDRQLRLMRSAGAETLIFLRDGDPSGQRAMIRDVSRAREQGFHVEVCSLDEGIDLDELCVALNSDPVRLYTYLEERRIAWHLFESRHVVKQYQKRIESLSTEIAHLQSRQLDELRVALCKIEDLALRYQAVQHAALWLNLPPEMILPDPNLIYERN